MRFRPLFLIAAFCVGFGVAPAFATSYPGSWKKVFGHSSSCTLGRASVNDSTDRGGALTSNFKGCSASNDPRSVPVKYLGANAYIRNYNNGAVCGSSGTKSNMSVASSRHASTLRASNSSSCTQAVCYFGQATNYRDSDSGVMSVRDDRVSNGAVWMPAWTVST